MIYVIFLAVLLGISFIVWLIYKIGYIDGESYGYKKGRAEALIQQIDKINDLCENGLKELEEDEKGKEAAVDDL
jgi:hypothetical protein